MSVVATGELMKPMAGLALLVAASAQFQADCTALAGAPQTSAGALNHVHYPEASDDGPVLPRAIVRFAPGFTSREHAPGTWRNGGTLELTFEYPLTNPTDDEGEQLALFANRIGGILDDLQALSGVGDAGDGETHLHVTEITDQYGLGKSNLVDDHGEAVGEPFFAACFLVRWEG